MDKKKIILILMIIVTIIIITIIAILLLNGKKQKEIVNNQKDKLISRLTEKVTKITNRAQFFNIDNHINQYFNYKKQNNIKAVKAISGDAVINSNDFQSREMYILNKITNYTVYVYGKEQQSNTYNDQYIMIHFDYQNYTFSIQNSSKQEFENAKNNIVQNIYKENINIQSNDYNEIILSEEANDFQILKKYFDDYKFKAINRPKEAFALLEVEYRKVKFHNDVNEFVQYVKSNLETLQDANIVKHGITKEGSVTKYTFVDQYNHYYEIRETGIYEYTITLDNYTLESSEQKQEYERLPEEQKAVSNMDKVMKLINEKDYSTVYGYLNTEFKNTNFPTIETFTTYMQANFFENNIVGKIGTRKEGNIYLLKVPYKESLSSVAEEGEKTFMMKLGEGTNFEISFEI